jgi:acyl-coenzyme A thioesterase PaaI-like protein
MVARSPPAGALKPLTEEDHQRLQSSPEGRRILSRHKPEDLRTLRWFGPDRRPSESTGDQMMTTTLSTPQTFSSFYGYWAVPSEECPLGQFVFTLTIGSGLNGHPHKMHGGAMSLLLDETMGRASRHHCSPGTVAFTATITVNYKKPVSTPGEILVRTWMEDKSDGRKHWVAAMVEQNGEVMATGHTLFLEVPTPYKGYHKV